MSLQQIVRPSGVTYAIDKATACAYGLRESILIQYLQREINALVFQKLPPKKEKYWCNDSVSKIGSYLPFMTEDEIKEAILSLIDQGIIMCDVDLGIAFVNEDAFIFAPRGDK